MTDERPTATWRTALQAALIGLVAGLALHAILSVVVIQAGESVPAHSGPKECKKSSPARDAATPPLDRPSVG